MTTVLQILVMIFVASVSGNKRANNKVKQMIEDAGCTFVDSRQLLVRNVCLKPNYQSNELPTNDGFEKTFIDIYLHEAKVLDIDEMKDKITIKLSQLMEWSEPRIRANFSAISKEVAQIKLSSKNIKSLWYPDLDMYTKDLEDWKSLYHPLLYQEVVVTKDPFLNQRHKKKNNNVISIHAWKDWVATIYCHFDFSSFPLDTQHCRFRQMGTSESVQPLLYPSLDIENWHYKSGGFEVKIDPVEAFKGKDVISQPNKTIDEIGFNVTLQRIVHPYLYQYYFPCFAIVIVSQISFIIPISAIPGRVALVVTQFLTLTNIFIHLMADSPSGANLNALGVYLLVSLFFVIATMIEFASVLIISRSRLVAMNDSLGVLHGNRKHLLGTQTFFRNMINSVAAGEGINDNGNRELAKQQTVRRKCYHNPDNLDYAALVLFLLSYITFNCYYIFIYI